MLPRERLSLSQWEVNPVAGEPARWAIGLTASSVVGEVGNHVVAQRELYYFIRLIVAVFAVQIPECRQHSPLLPNTDQAYYLPPVICAACHCSKLKLQSTKYKPIEFPTRVVSGSATKVTRPTFHDGRGWLITVTAIFVRGRVAQSPDTGFVRPFIACSRLQHSVDGYLWRDTAGIIIINSSSLDRRLSFLVDSFPAASHTVHTISHASKDMVLTQRCCIMIANSSFHLASGE